MEQALEENERSDEAPSSEWQAPRKPRGWGRNLFRRGGETCPRNTERPCSEADGASESCLVRMGGCPLALADEGVWLKVVGLRPGRNVQHRLIELGLKVGSRICILQRGGSCPMLIGVGDSRLALGHGLAGKIMVEPANQDPHEERPC
jgi:Fe2+ transport system protein FeoA